MAKPKLCVHSLCWWCTDHPNIKGSFLHWWVFILFLFNLIYHKVKQHLHRYSNKLLQGNDSIMILDINFINWNNLFFNSHIISTTRKWHLTRETMEFFYLTPLLIVNAVVKDPTLVGWIDLIYQFTICLK